MQEIRIGTAFNKNTGESIDIWDLFSLPKKEVFQQLMAVSYIEDTDFIAEMESAMKSEYIIFFPNHLEINFPQGTLPSQEHSYGIGIEYGDLKDLLYDWAIPYSISQ